jgi:hypothetical protein
MKKNYSAQKGGFPIMLPHQLSQPLSQSQAGK